MGDAFTRLVRNVEINGIRNVVANPLGLWDSDEIMLEVAGDLALASSGEATIVEGQYRPEHGGLGEIVQSVTISRYVAANNLASVELIMLDTEGGEERLLLGAQHLLSQDIGRAPNIVFEVHCDYVDWSAGLENTSIVKMLQTHGYEIFAES